MASRATSFPVVLVAVAAAVAVLLWIRSAPDPGAVERARDAPEGIGSGLPQAVADPVVAVTSGMGDPAGNPSGEVTADSLLVDVEGDRLTATSLVDGDPVWSYGREDREIDGWAVSGAAAWVLFDDQLLVRIDVETAEVDDSTVFDRLYDDTAPALAGDGSGGLVIQGPADAAKPVWWVGSEVDPAAVELPGACDAYDDVTSDGERIFLVARCDGGEARVMAFTTVGSIEWANEPGAVRSLQLDRGLLVAHGNAGSALVDPDSGEIVGRVPAGPDRHRYVAASGGLVAAWESDAPPSRPSLAVWSVDQRRFVWRLPGMGRQGEVSAPLLSDGRVFYTQSTYGAESSHRLVVVDVASGESSSTELQAPDPDSCEGAATSFRPRLRAGIPGGLVVSWQDDNFCADPVLEVYGEAESPEG